MMASWAAAMTRRMRAARDRHGPGADRRQSTRVWPERGRPEVRDRRRWSGSPIRGILYGPACTARHEPMRSITSGGPSAAAVTLAVLATCATAAARQQTVFRAGTRTVSVYATV